jgi:excisionase family DNA binding protein
VTERGAYNPAEAAAWLSISRTQLYRLVKAGELRARRCGTRLLISRKALDEYLNVNDAAPKDGAADMFADPGRHSRRS